MAFPQDVLDIDFEVNVAGTWLSMPERAYRRDTISMRRGRGATLNGRVDFGECSVSLQNNDGYLSPDDPVSPYFGLIGPSTPCRVSVSGYDFPADLFRRKVFGGWGRSDVYGSEWTIYGTGGTFDPDTQYVVNPGGNSFGVEAAMVVTTAPGTRSAWMEDVTLADVVTSTRVDIEAADITGAGAYVSLLLRMAGETECYEARMTVNADQSVTASLRAPIGGVLATATVSGLTHSGQVLNIKAEVLGSTLRMRVWEHGDTEPATWDVSDTDTEITAAGAVGVRSGRDTSNTNANLTFSYKRFTINRTPRFTGEAAGWPAAWAHAANDVWVPLKIHGLLKRIGKAGLNTPAASAMRRHTDYWSRARAPVGWWPLEDEGGIENVSPASSALANVGPMDAGPASAGTHRFSGVVAGAVSGPVGAARAVDLSRGGQLTGRPIIADSNTWRVECAFLFNNPIDTVADPGASGQILRLYTSGVPGGVDDNSSTWGIFASDTAGFELSIEALDDSSFNSDNVAVVVDDGRWHYLGLDAIPDGADTDYVLWIDGVPVLSGTMTGIQAGPVNTITMSPTGELSAASHVKIWAPVPDGYSGDDQAFAGWVGETAGNRASRISEEQGWLFGYIGNLDETELMGPQRTSPPHEIMQDAAEAEMGILYEPRGFVGLMFRTHRSLYNQAIDAQLTYSASGEMVGFLNPTDDTMLIENQVTAVRAFTGESYTSTVTEGPYSTAEPTATPKGVGIQATAPGFNVASSTQLPDLAGWRTHVGTFGTRRFPRLPVNFAALANAGRDDLVAAVAALDIGDACGIDGLPTFANGVSDTTLLWQGSTEVFASGKQWQMNANLVPEGPFQVAVEGVGRYDSRDTYLLHALTDSDTTALIRVHGHEGRRGTRWGTSSPPYDWRIDAERATVTAMSSLTPTYVGVGTVAHGNNASVVPGLPGGMQKGDCMILLGAIRNSPFGNPNAPTGWTQIYNSSNVRLFGKVHSGSESAPTVTFDDGIANAATTAQIAAFRGLQARVIRSDFLLNSSAASILYPSLYLRRDACVVLTIGWKERVMTGVTGPGTEIAEASTTNGDDQMIAWYYTIQTTGVTQAAGTMTVSGGTNGISRGIVVALPSDIQSATLTRGVNGIPQAHVIESQARLWTPARYGK